MLNVGPFSHKVVHSLRHVSLLGSRSNLARDGPKQRRLASTSGLESSFKAPSPCNLRRSRRSLTRVRFPYSVRCLCPAVWPLCPFDQSPPRLQRSAKSLRAPPTRAARTAWASYRPGTPQRVPPTFGKSVKGDLYRAHEAKPPRPPKPPSNWAPPSLAPHLVPF